MTPGFKPEVPRYDRWDPAIYRTKEWREARAAALERAGGRCEMPGCRSRSVVEVHHRLGVMLDPGHTDLVVLCRACHHNADALARRGRNLTPELGQAILGLALEKVAAQRAAKEERT